MGGQPGAANPIGSSPVGIDSTIAQYAVSVVGPPNDQLQQGDTVIYRINVDNRGDTPLSNVKVFATFAPEFRFEAASYQEEQYKFTRPTGAPNSLEWTFPTIGAKSSLKEPIQVQVTCVRTTQANSKAFVRVRVNDAKTATAGEASATIVNTRAAPQSSLSKTSLQLTRADAQPSVQVGRALDYAVVLSNEGSESDRNVRLSIQVSPELQFRQEDIRASSQLKPSIRNENQSQFIDFEIPELRTRETISIFLRATAIKPNQGATVGASFRSDAQPQGVAAQPNTVQIYQQ
jgi:uncharacterized repeat protein (TIGR01451 family)